VRYLSIQEVEALHDRLVQQSGGASGLRDRGSLESSVLQPLQSFNGHDLYPSLVEKAAALGFFLIQNHPFLDGNKRIGHAAVEAVLMLNGYELSGSVDEQEEVILRVARGESSREQFAAWVEKRAVTVAHPGGF
jgi:death-on-curing protein